jgi:hypothetical protein
VLVGAVDLLCELSANEEELPQPQSKSRQAAAVMIYLNILSPLFWFLPILSRAGGYVKPKTLRCVNGGLSGGLLTMTMLSQHRAAHGACMACG